MSSNINAVRINVLGAKLNGLNSVLSKVMKRIISRPPQVANAKLKAVKIAVFLCAGIFQKCFLVGE